MLSRAYRQDCTSCQLCLYISKQSCSANLKPANRESDRARVMSICHFTLCNRQPPFTLHPLAALPHHPLKFCLQCTISRATPPNPLAPFSQPFSPRKRGASLNATSKNQCNPKAAPCNPFGTPSKPLSEPLWHLFSRVEYIKKVHLPCLWVGVDRRHAGLLDCRK